MSELPPLFMTSGDLIADRRVELACQYRAAGDVPAAADLFAQAVERAPQFAWGWFLLGEARRELGRALQLENERPHQQEEGDEAGNRVARKADDPTSALAGEHQRLTRPHRDLPEIEFDPGSRECLLNQVMHAHRCSAGRD